MRERVLLAPVMTLEGPVRPPEGALAFCKGRLLGGHETGIFPGGFLLFVGFFEVRFFFLVLRGDLSTSLLVVFDRCFSSFPEGFPAYKAWRLASGQSRSRAKIDRYAPERLFGKAKNA